MAKPSTEPDRQHQGSVTGHPVRVVIADDRAPAREALKALLSLRDDVIVAGMARDGYGAVALATSHQPDVVLMDARMPGMGGLEAARVIKRRCPGVRVVITTMYPTSRTEPFAEAADAILLKGCPTEELVEAIYGHPTERHGEPAAQINLRRPPRWEPRRNAITGRRTAASRKEEDH